jgi:hypothetical protein
MGREEDVRVLPVLVGLLLGDELFPDARRLEPALVMRSSPISSASRSWSRLKAKRLATMARLAALPTAPRPRPRKTPISEVVRIVRQRCSEWRSR